MNLQCVLYRMLTMNLQCVLYRMLTDVYLIAKRVPYAFDYFNKVIQERRFWMEVALNMEKFRVMGSRLRPIKKNPLKVIDLQGILISVAVRTGLTEFLI